MDKKAQLYSVAVFVILLAVMIIVAPIILRVAVSIMDKTSVQLGTIDTTNRSSSTVNFVQNKLTGTFDWVIMIIVIFNILLLLISAFLIDVHPAFVVIYIIGAFVLVLTAPYTMMTAEKIYSMSQMTGSDGVIQFIPMTEFMMNNFGVIIVGVLVLTGIIMYAKIKVGSGVSSGGNY